jgi:hypothetical protein
MKRIFLSLLAVVFLASCNNEQKQTESTITNNSATNANVSPSPDASHAAAFQFEKESYDFGQITTGEKVSYSFAFKNVGKEPLIITGAIASCGCTKPEFPKEPIAPGANGEISVTFDSKGKMGMQNKVITVTANTVPSSTELHMIGDVLPAKNN